MKILISIFLFLFSFGVSLGQNAELKVLGNDTIVAIPLKYLSVINGTFEENDWLKKEIRLKDSLIHTDSLIIKEKDEQIDSWIKRDQMWNNELKREKNKRKKLILGTGLGATLIGILIGVLIK